MLIVLGDADSSLSCEKALFLVCTTFFAAIMAVSHVRAQEPIFVPSTPEWSTDAQTSSMVLNPISSARLALGLNAARARLQIFGESITTEPGVGYVVLGDHNSIHMKLDRNDIQVSGGSVNTVGSLYLQRFGGPMVVHGSGDLADRVYFPTHGGLGVGTADPREFAVNQNFISEDWPSPDTALGVAGDIYGDVVWSNEVKIMDRLRVGRKSDLAPGGAWDGRATDAIVMIGGKLSAQEIIVHIDKWADDVFDDDYPLMALEDVEEFLEREHHLPGLPSEESIKTSGMDVASANAALLRKTEELTLYLIEQNKRIEVLERQLAERRGTDRP